MHSLTGQMIGQFAINTLLRADHAFAVYEAHDTLAGDQPESKVQFWVVFPDSAGYSDVFRHRFIERLDLLSLLEFPNLVPILKFGQEQDRIYWVTPDIQGQFLTGAIKQTWAEKDAARIAGGIAAGLEYLHQQDVFHGALSPDNVVLGPDQEVFLYNYGIAGLMNAEIQQMLPEGMLGFGIGNPAYMAPEQITRQETTPAADIYALGALYFALLVGRGPRETEAPVETAIRQIIDPPSWPDKLPVKVSQASIRLIHKCLSSAPADRFKKAGEARALLERISHRKRASIRVRKAQMAGAPKPSPWPLRLSLLAAIITLAGVLVYWQSTQPGGWSFLFPPAVARTHSPSTAAPGPGEVVAAVEGTTAPVVQVTQSPARQDAVTQTPEPTAGPAQAGNPTPVPQPTALPASADSAIQPVLVGTLVSGSPEIIQASNVEQVREILRLGFGKLNQVAQSPDGQVIAVASTAGVFILGQDGQLRDFLDPQDEASSVTFSPYADTLAVGLRLGDIQIWKWKDHQKISTLKGHKGRVSKILFSPNKRNLISASYDLYIKVWDLASATEFKSVKAHPQPIRDIAITAGDGRYLASVSDDQRVLLWDISTLRDPVEFIHPAPSSVALSEDGQFLAIGGKNGEITQWNISARQLRAYVDPIFMTRAVWGLVYDNSQFTDLRVLLDDGNVRVISAMQKNSLNALQNKEVPTTPKELYDKLGNDFEFNANAAIQPGSTGATVLWDGTLRSDSKFAFPQPTAFEDFKKIFFSPDSRYLIAGGPLSHAYLWNVAENSMGGMKSADLATGSPFSDDSSLVALTERSRIYGNNPAEAGIVVDTASLFSGKDLTKIHTLSSVPLGSSMQFTLDDSLLVAGTIMQTKFWDIKSGLETRVSEGNNSGCQLARSVNDGAILSVYSPIGMMREWDNKTQMLCNLGARFGSRWAFFSADRTYLIYENANGLLELFNTETNSVVWKTPLEFEVGAVAFSPDRSMIVIGGQDGTLTFLDAQDHTRLRVFQAHPGPIRSVAFSPDGKRIATGSADGTVRVWEVLPGFGQ